MTAAEVAKASDVTGGDRSARAPAPRRAAASDRTRAERRLGWALVAPAALVMGLVTAYPIGYALWLSLHRADLRFPDETEFIGLRNYGDVLSSPLWWTDLGTTVLITVISVAIELVLGMALAVVMHRALVGRGLVRASILVPYGIVSVVGALSWQFAFTPGVGFINAWADSDTAWLASRGTSLVVIIATEVWKTTPFIALLLLAGLATVPPLLTEAAKVDGATSWQAFTRVTLPNMRNAVIVAVLFRTLDAFRIFDTIYIQTRGANNTESVSILGYNQLINRLNLGVGSTVSVLIFVCVIIIAIGFVKGLGVTISQGREGR